MKSQGRFLSYDALKAFVKTVFVNFQRVYICIDALDEFPNNHISELFELLQILKEPQVAILVSSRPSSLHLQLSNFLRISTLEIRTHQTNDIALYTKSRFRQSQRLQSRPELQHFLIQEIIQRGDGM
jgi:hypothetical protein